MIYAVCEQNRNNPFYKIITKKGLNTQINENDSISTQNLKTINNNCKECWKTPFLILDEATSNVDTKGQISTKQWIN